MQVSGDKARLLRGRTEIGSFELDEHLQIQGVTITAAATASEAGQIIRLASSHVAQYNVTGRVARESIGYILGANTKFPPLPGMTKRLSRSLLDFDNIAPEHAGMMVRDLRMVLKAIGVRITELR